MLGFRGGPRDCAISNLEPEGVRHVSRWEGWRIDRCRELFDESINAAKVCNRASGGSGLSSQIWVELRFLAGGEVRRISAYEGALRRAFSEAQHRQPNRAVATATTLTSRP